MERKQILITGSGGNLGTAVIPILMQKGFGIIAITSPRKKLNIEGMIEYQADLTNEKDVEVLSSKLRNDHQRIDAALFLAGSYEGGNINNIDGAALKRMYSINFETTFYLAKQLFTSMRSSGAGGRIVFIGSKPSLEPSIGRHSIAYALSKSLLLTLAEQFNAEGSTSGVESFVVAPGTIDTPANRRDMPDANFASWNKPEEIAKIFIEVIEGKRSGKTLIRLY